MLYKLWSWGLNTRRKIRTLIIHPLNMEIPTEPVCPTRGVHSKVLSGDAPQINYNYYFFKQQLFVAS